MSYLQQRLTIFDVDDTTPLLGAVDGAGHVTDPTFSTDPAHARPYLEFSEEVGESKINFAEGSSDIGQANLVVGDKERTAGNQVTGIMTWLMSDGSENRILRRRALWEGLLADGVTWATLLDGIVYNSKLGSDLCSYEIPLRDIRERERRVRAFASCRDTVLFPKVGPRDGWGHQTLYDATAGRVIFDTSTPPVLPPTLGAIGIWEQDLLGGSKVHFSYANNNNAELLKATETLKDTWTKYGEAIPIGKETVGADPFFFPGITFTKYAYAGIIAEWSGDSGATWHTFSIMPTGFTGLGNVQYSSNAFDFEEVDGVTRLKSVMLNPSAGDVAPVNGAAVMVRYLSNQPPSSEVPAWIELESIGLLVKKLYDGDYSDPQVPPNVRYDAAAIASMIARGEPVLAKIEEVVTDLRAWIQEHAYKAYGWAPALSEDGKVAPIKYEIPDASVVLPQLDDSNTYTASWSHGDTYAVNKVSFTYKRDLIPTELNTEQKILTQDVVVEDWHIGSQALFGEKALTYAPVTARAVAPYNYKFPVNADITQEVGWRLAVRRAADALTRFALGAQECVAECNANDPAVANAKAGDWRIVACSWLPDYQTRQRGMSRLMQISRVRKTSPLVRELTLVDAGALNTPVAQPVVGNFVLHADGAITCDVTSIPAGVGGQIGFARLDYAVGETQPPIDSGAWTLLSRPNTVGTVSTPPMQSDALVWIRWRGEAAGARPSAWHAPVSTRVGTIARMNDLTLAIVSGAPRVRWAHLPTTGGVRITYERYARNAAIPAALTQHVDVAASALTTDLPIVLRQYENVAIQLTAYPGFAGGVVTGAAGATSTILTAQRFDGLYRAPMVEESKSQDAVSGTLDLNITDPNGVVTLVEFRHRAGNSGAWSAWATDSFLPYEDIVAMVGDEESMIEYRVSGYDALGNVALLAQSQESFTRVLKGFVECQVIQTGVTDTTSTYMVNAITPDGTPGQVMLIATPAGSASLASGQPAVGSSQPSGASWTFVRGAPNASDGKSGDGYARFKAFLSPYQSDEQPVVIPGQGRDSVSLYVRAHVSAYTATQLTVDVQVIDPVSQGASPYITLTPLIFGTGGVVPGTAQAATNGSTTSFTVSRAAFGNAFGRVTFVASAPNRTNGMDAVDVPTVDATNALGIRIETLPPATGQTLTHIKVRVYAVDPAPQGVGTILLTYTTDGVSSVTPASSQSIGTPTALFATTGFVDFTIPRPTSGSRDGSVTFTASDTTGKREQAAERVNVPAIAAVSGGADLKITMVSQGPVSETYQLDVVDATGSSAGGVVRITQLLGGTSILAGGALNTDFATGHQWQLSRPSGSNNAQFVGRGVVSGATDEDTQVVVGQENDTIRLIVKATPISVLSDRIVVGVTCTDPVPQGGTYIQLDIPAYVNVSISPLSTWLGGSTFTQNITIFRGAYGTGPGKVQFRASIYGPSGAVARVEDFDSVDVDSTMATEQLGIKVVQTGITSSTITYRVYATDPHPQGGGTVTIRRDGGSPSSIGTPTSDFSTTGYVDYTISRGGSDATTQFLAEAGGRASASQSAPIPGTGGASAVVFSSVSVTPNYVTGQVTVSWTDSGGISALGYYQVWFQEPVFSAATPNPKMVGTSMTQNGSVSFYPTLTIHSAGGPDTFYAWVVAVSQYAYAEEGRSGVQIATINHL